MCGARVKGLIAISLAVVFLMSPAAGFADDVTDAINEALKYYKEGQYSSAVQNLNYASQVIQQKKGEGLTAFLPEPLSGWTAQEASSQAAGAAMFGGGITVGREYTKDESTVTIQIITDSPVMQSMVLMLSNPMYATSDGGKLERIKGQNAIVKFNTADNSGDIKMVVANRYFITLEGRQTTMEDLLAYARAINFNKLAAEE
jgi:hypothetical protein